jgi:hypothetical protein
MDHADTQMKAMHSFLARRQDEILGSICKLVETESPSGDFEGSRAVVDLLVENALSIPAICSVERIPVSGYGEHLRVRAFDGRDHDTGHNAVAWAHRYGSSARCTVYPESAR